MKEEGDLFLVKCGEEMPGAPTTKDYPDGGSVKMDEMARLKERVLQLLQGRIYGLLVSQVEKMYLKQWSEK